MHSLLGIAAALGVALSAAPAAAHDWPASQGSGAVDLHRHVGDHAAVRFGRPGHGDFDRDRRGRSGRSRGSDGVFVGDWYGGDWALANNRSWDSDSFNDWWNDRPDRAFPRWVNEQRAAGTCEPDRMWWSGSGWHC